MNRDKEDYIGLENDDFADFMLHKPFIHELIQVFLSDKDIQLIRGSDYQYMLMIDKKFYAPSITPGGALLYGIKQYLRQDNDANKNNMEV
jgi:hypothetical protein